MALLKPRNSDSQEPCDQASSGNPAIGRNGQDARALERDGHHPKEKDHGRIAGRWSRYRDQLLAILRMVFLFSNACPFVKIMKEDHNVQ